MSEPSIKISWRTPFDQHSIIHFFGSFMLVLFLDLLRPHPLSSAIAVFTAGLLWELVVDGTGWFKWLSLTDPTGGDWYDVVYDAAGCVLGWWVLGWGAAL